MEKTTVPDMMTAHAVRHNHPFDLQNKGFNAKAYWLGGLILFPFMMLAAVLLQSEIGAVAFLIVGFSLIFVLVNIRYVQYVRAKRRREHPIPDEE